MTSSRSFGHRSATKLPIGSPVSGIAIRQRALRVVRGQVLCPVEGERGVR